MRNTSNDVFNDNEKYIQILKHLLPNPPFFLSLTLLLFFSTSSPPQCRGMGNGGCGQFVTCSLCCYLLLGGELLTFFPCSSMWSFPWAAVLHELLQCGSLPWSAVLQEQAAPAWVPHGVMSPASKPAPVWAPVSMGPQVLPGACSNMGSPWGHSLLQASTCSGVGSSAGCRWISAPPWTSMGCRGAACLTMVVSTGCRRTFAPVLGAPPPPPSSLTLVSAGLFLSSILTPLFILLQVLHSVFPPPLLKYVIRGGFALSGTGEASSSFSQKARL